MLLFIIHSIGGTIELDRLFLLIYLADLKYLAKFGTLISGDTYIAMKGGPAPFHILILYEQLKDGWTQKKESLKSKSYIKINSENQIVALVPYDMSRLASSEVACLFETIQQYKGFSIELLRAKAKSKGWNCAQGVEISLDDMVAESEATSEMINYIKMCYEDEINSFNDEPEN